MRRLAPGEEYLHRQAGFYSRIRPHSIGDLWSAHTRARAGGFAGTESARELDPRRDQRCVVRSPCERPDGFARGAKKNAGQTCDNPGDQQDDGCDRTDQLQQITSEGTSSPGLAATGHGAVIPSGLNNAEILENSFTDLTVATLVIGEAGAVRMVGNQTTDCQAGLWIVAPTEAEPLALDTTDLAIMVGSSIAIGYPPPQGDATTAVTVAAAPASVRVYAGAKSNTDGLSDVWTPDAAASTAFKVSGGALSQPSPPPTIINPLPTSSDQALYQSERYGTFTFTFAGLAEGYYQVTLKLAEIFWNAAQKRLIEVFINGVQVLVDFDIFADAGGKDIADDKVFANIPSSGGEIKIDFSAASYSPDQNAKVSAIAIDAQWSSSFVSASLSGSVRNPASVSELQNFCAQLTALAQQGFAGLAFTAPALRIDSNEMAGLSSSAVVILSDNSVQNGHTSSLTMSGNRLAGDVPQMAVATLIGVSQCVVCGNTILNQDRNSDRRVALTLRDSAVPTPQIAVTGNLFQGRAVISPALPVRFEFDLSSRNFLGFPEYDQLIRPFCRLDLRTSSVVKAQASGR